MYVCIIISAQMVNCFYHNPPLGEGVGGGGDSFSCSCENVSFYSHFSCRLTFGACVHERMIQIRTAILVLELDNVSGKC